MRKSVLLVSAVLFLLFSLVSSMGCKQQPASAPTPTSPSLPPTTVPVPTPTLSLTSTPTPTPTPPPALSPHPSGSPPAEVIYYPRSGKSWSKIPSVTISSQASDNRTRLVYEAIDFWNQQLEEIGTPFRFGPVTHKTELVPTDYLEAASSAVLEGKTRPEPPESVKNIPGDLIIALSDGNFVSFSGLPGSKYSIVGIRNFRVSPLNLTNVGRNVIAHELGHSIGLGHHNDPTKLMCGRPADCRPGDFQSDREHFFSITDEEKVYLLELYPPSWKPSQ